MRLLKLFIFFCLLTAFSSCKKDPDTVDFTPTFHFVNGGTSSFDENLILFPSADTISYNVTVSSTYPLSKSTEVTLAVADDYRVAYNASNTTDYEAMPAAAYSFQTSFTARSNTTDTTIRVKINKQLLSSGNFMLPIRITSVSNYKIDSASSVIYLHTSDNDLSGIYNSTGKKTLYIGDTADNRVSETDTFSFTKKLIPLTSYSSQLDYADLGSNGWKYTIGFSPDDGSFFAAPNDVILKSVQSDSFKILKASFNSATKIIYIKSTYKNLSGDGRIIEETLTLQ
jgi:hypothetical protein